MGTSLLALLAPNVQACWYDMRESSDPFVDTAVAGQAGNTNKWKAVTYTPRTFQFDYFFFFGIFFVFHLGHGIAHRAALLCSPGIFTGRTTARGSGRVMVARPDSLVMFRTPPDRTCVHP